MSQRTSQGDLTGIYLSVKQRLSLSPQMVAIMRADQYNYTGEDNQNGYLNHVIACMMEHSAANILTNRDTIKERLRPVYTGDEASLDALCEALARRERGRLLEAYRQCKEESAYEESCTILLSKDNLYRLGREGIPYEPCCNWGSAEERQQDNTLFKNRKEFIEALLYDYSSRPAILREELYYGSRIADLRTDCQNMTNLILTTRIMRSTSVEEPDDHHVSGRRKAAQARLFDVATFLVIPYKVMRGKNGTCNYLACMSRPLDAPDSAFVTASFLISRIEDIKRWNAGKVLTSEYLDRLNTRMKALGIEYLLERNTLAANGAPSHTLPDEVCSIQVYLTEEGIRLYDRTFIGRPTPSAPPRRVDGGEILTFTLTRYRIETYFAPFGKEARIISPPEYAAEMLARYQAAVAAYQSPIPDAWIE